jgi:hypothetical protein
MCIYRSKKDSICGSNITTIDGNLMEFKFRTRLTSNKPLKVSGLFDVSNYLFSRDAGISGVSENRIQHRYCFCFKE